jgi:flavin reductase (DIM6/NTAB) family NADH-FMN oxidoreductase RutF
MRRWATTSELGDDLRRVMRSFPAGVAVVTVDVAGERVGLTLGSLVSLSLDPPLVGLSVSRFAALHELLRRAGAFAVSLLAAGQEALAQHFARGVPPIGLWRGVPVRGEPDDAPLLEGALGWLRCDVAAEYPAGDHTFFVGSVRTVEPGPGAAPLVYVDGGYRAL